MFGSNGDHATLTTLTKCYVIVLILSSTTAIPPTVDIVIMSVPDALDHPVWDKSFQCLFFVGKTKGKMHMYDEREDSISIIQFEYETKASFIVPASPQGTNSRFVAGTSMSMSVFLFEKDMDVPPSGIDIQRAIAFDVQENEFLITAKTDLKGLLWVGSDKGSVFSVSSDGVANRVLSDVGEPRGFAWNVDFTKFYRSDSSKSIIVQHGYDPEKGEISPDSKVVFDFVAKKVAGVPGGIVIDKADNLWIACAGTANVVKINPTDGTVLMTFQVPNGTVTSVAFGLEKMDVLFVTTLRDYGTSMPMFGALYRVTDINSTGLDSEPFHLA